MRKDKYRFGQDYLPQALTKIQTAHHNAYYSDFPMADLHYENLTDGRCFNPDFVTFEIRNSSLFVRRTLKRNQSQGTPPYSTMTTCQLLGPDMSLDRMSILKYCWELAEAIYDANTVLSGHELDIMADPSLGISSEPPKWCPVDKEHVVQHIMRFITFCMSSKFITLTLRFSNRTGLTLRTQVPSQMLRSAPTDINVQEARGHRDRSILMSRFSMTSYE